MKGQTFHLPTYFILKLFEKLLRVLTIELRILFQVPESSQVGKVKKKKVWASIKPLQQTIFLYNMDTKRTLPPPTEDEETGLIMWNICGKEFLVSLNNFR